MKLGYGNLNKEGLVGISLENSILQFASTAPVIIQPSEIQRVPIEAVIEIEEGYILNIGTHPSLYDRAGEIFPAYLILDHTYVEPLLLPVRNNGRNPLNIMPGQSLAVGYVTKVCDVESYEFEPSPPKAATKTKSKPQKKNTPFKFEIK